MEIKGTGIAKNINTPEYHHLGKNKNQRDKYKGHKYFNDTVDFCEKWDQASFDPNFKSMTLEDFTPMVKRIFSRKPYSHF